MKKSWMDYWKNNKQSNNKKLSNFQRIIIDDINSFVKDKKEVNILSAGSGYDLIARELLKTNDNIKITIMDISLDVIHMNQKLLKDLDHSKTIFIVGDLFKIPFKSNQFDLVYNSGVLEHFNRKEQISMTKEIVRVLKNYGYFYTYNPSAKGRLYIKGMNKGRETGEWSHDIETPIKSLKFLKKEIKDIRHINEFDVDALSQINFLKYYSKNKYYKYFIYGIVHIINLPYINFVVDKIVKSMFGTYIKKSIILKVKK